MSNKRNFREGTWFGVPLEKGGFAIGVIMRLDDFVMLAAFFGPRRKKPPTRGDVKACVPPNAVWVGRVSALGIAKGHWPVISHDAAFNRSRWPLALFFRFHGEERARVTLEDEPSLTMYGLHGYESAAGEIDQQLLAPPKPAFRLAAEPHSNAREPDQRKTIQQRKPKKVEQAVLIKFGPLHPKWLRPFEGKLRRLIPDSIGEYDGHEIETDGSGGKLYFYGASASALWKRIEATVRSAPFMRGATVRLRRGPPGAREREIVLK